MGEDPRPTPRREKQTLIPEFDPEALARELEAQPDRPTVQPPFDPAAYARIVDANVSVAAESARDTPRTMTAATPVAGAGAGAGAPGGGDAAGAEADEPSDLAHIEPPTESIGRAMYGSYLESDFPEALVLAERVLEREPTHALAMLVAEKCRERLAPASPAPLVPSSVLRLRAQPSDVASLRLDPASEIVLHHVDGFLDAGTVAELAGIPPAEALDRLHALLNLGVLEVVNG